MEFKLEHLGQPERWIELGLPMLLKFTIGVRVSEEAESEGLDLAEHGEEGYNE